MFILTLQGPTVDGNCVLESWEIPADEYARLRAMITNPPLATTVTDGRATVISQRFIDDEEIG